MAKGIRDAELLTREAILGVDPAKSQAAPLTAAEVEFYRRVRADMDRHPGIVFETTDGLRHPIELIPVADLPKDKRRDVRRQGAVGRCRLCYRPVVVDTLGRYEHRGY
jgi:hypothetical protein